jgi:tetratricopeptide (TPR) repeat protein
MDNSTFDIGSRLDDSHKKYLAGRTLMASGDYAGAIDFFESSNRAYPHFKTLELLGECQLGLGNPFEALIPLAAAIGLGSNAFRAAYLLAQAFADLGEKKDALIYVERALVMKPDFKRARQLKESLGVDD